MLIVAFKIASIILFTIAHQVYKPPLEKGIKYVVEDGSIRTESVTSSVTMVSADKK